MTDEKVNDRQFLGSPYGTYLADWLNATEGGEEKAFLLALLEAAARRSAQGVAKKLAGVALHPQTIVSPEFGNAISFTVARGSQLRDLKTTIDSCWYDYGTGDAIMAVLTLWERGLADRVLQCPCGTWFHGRFARSKYCSLACQQSLGRHTDEFKERHRDYMREYQRERRSKLHSKKT